MSLGVIITHGSDNQQFPQSTLQYLVEARVEQELSGAYRYAIRFEEDICGKYLENSSLETFRAGTIISVLVHAADSGDVMCLVRGPITKIKTSVVTGGTGSWFECHGEDMRQLLDRQAFEATWTGHASQIVKQRVEGAGLTIDEPEQTDIDYQGENKLSQSGTDLQFIETAARENNLEFWVKYPAISGADVPEKGPIAIEEKFQFKSSPERADLASNVISIPILPATSEATLFVNPIEGEDCINTLSFDLDVNEERATSAFLTELQDGELVTREVFTPEPEMPADAPSTPPPPDNTPRAIQERPSGTPEEQHLRAEAALTEASWFIEASCSTSLFLFKKPLYPHEVVAVKGLGPVHDGTYQVSSVTHVINPESHMMDLKLRRNTFNVAEVRAPAETGATVGVANAG